MSSYLPTFIGLGIVLATGLAMSWVISRRKKWRAVGKISKIYIYPIKSGRYKEIDEAECTPIGLSYNVGDGKLPLRDRVFVVYKSETMAFLSGKNNPKMLLLNLKPKDDKTVIFSYPGKSNIEITLPNKHNNKMITMWKDEKIRINDCGDDAAKWVSEAVGGKECEFRLAYFPLNDGWRRDISYRKLEFEVFKNTKNKYTGAYSDLSSYNMMNESSFKELKSRLTNGNRAKILNFRPNFVIEGPEAYEEDNWHWIKIGDAVFERFRPCTRCVFVTIDCDTMEKDENTEPLSTLRKYRTMKMLGEDRIDAHTPVLGLNAGLYQVGKVKVGDTVYVSD
ncbi:mitochondrial amidoxime-reducing component 1 [Halyomorpha halys]|uniref:mitochondrial amidoxime-reducing component 1 n=1 Tax=Halyomorpha halys TaxID=286706 RepID=UPI0006D4F44B|nr:mitochondrial amidoxime-reducing component 1 [Halyomorpha halys]XP_014285775.1 mitochondrial amidoxime-reducing component 1 [Halyomorpha halys]XP_014285776.1 mitochondrial amidoxime-reducing component 1 [Halyomorpha halys]